MPPWACWVLLSSSPAFATTATAAPSCAAASAARLPAAPAPTTKTSKRYCGTRRRSTATKLRSSSRGLVDNQRDSGRPF